MRTTQAFASALLYPMLLSDGVHAADNRLPEPYDFQVMYNETKQRINMQWTIKDGSSMTINLGPTTETGIDTITCSVTKRGVGSCADTTSQGVTSAIPPRADEKVNITYVLAQGEIEGTTTITMIRSLDTGDENDFVIPLDTDFNVNWKVN